MRGSWMLASLVVLAAAPALAQSNIAAGELHGVITDPSGAIVPAAKVTVTNETTGFSRRTLTDENGGYRMLLVPPGIYALQVERAGFHTRVAKDVQVTVGQIAVVDIKLELAPSAWWWRLPAPKALSKEKEHTRPTPLRSGTSRLF